MAKQSSSCKHGFILFLVLFMQHLHTNTAATTAPWQPMKCDDVSPSCSSFLYATSEGRSLSKIAAVFNANASLLQTIKRPSGVVDVLVGVPCTCEAINDTMTALFHDTQYKVEKGDTPETVKINKFSGLAMNVGDGKVLFANDTITVHLPCGCSSAKSVLSYAVQEEDTLPKIASLFGTSSQDILNFNPSLVNPNFVEPGWILFVPTGVDGSS